MNQIYLKLQIQLTKKDGTNFADTDTKTQADFINNIIHSIFKGLSVELNGQVVSNTHLYNYKSYLEELLNYQKDRAESLSTTNGFFLDTGGQFDNLAKNSGATSRNDRTKNSKLLELYGKVHCDIFNINMQKLLIGVYI